MKQPLPLVLASQSPRRREILDKLGLRFEVVPAHIDETPGPGETPADYARRMAFEKARAVAQAHAGSATLGADTIVVCEGELMGKPRDDDDALRMLNLLAGRWHEVTTAVCVCRADQPFRAREVVTRVRFRSLGDEALRRYVATGEGRDKAGSYGIQEIGAGLVAEVQGSYTNVVGLPAVESLELLEAVGAVGQWP